MLLKDGIPLTAAICHFLFFFCSTFLRSDEIISCSRTVLIFAWLCRRPRVASGQSRQTDWSSADDGVVPASVYSAPHIYTSLRCSDDNRVDPLCFNQFSRTSRWCVKAALCWFFNVSCCTGVKWVSPWGCAPSTLLLCSDCTLSSSLCLFLWLGASSSSSSGFCCADHSSPWGQVVGMGWQRQWETNRKRHPGSIMKINSHRRQTVLHIPSRRVIPLCCVFWLFVVNDSRQRFALCPCSKSN